MNFSSFSKQLLQIESTPKRLEMTTLLAELYKQLSSSEIKPASYLLLGGLVAAYDSKEFQISTKMILRVFSRLSNLDEKKILDLYHQLGDLGDVAQQILTRVSDADFAKLSLLEVYQELTEIADFSGTGSQEMKLNAIVKLLEKVDPVSAKYVVRIILGKLRLGFSEMTIIDALSYVIASDKSLHTPIEEAFQKRADIGYIAQVVLSEGVDALQRVKVMTGTPVIPALCQRLNSAEEIIEKMGDVYAEPKYDGTRVQIHLLKREKQNGSEYTIRTYTRNLEESTAMFPELHEAVKTLRCQSCILDAEAVGYDLKTGKLLVFQQTIQRKRKHGVEAFAKDIPLRFFVFDILEIDGESLIGQPLSYRKARLQQLFEDNQFFVHSSYIQTSDAKTLHQYHTDQLALGLEGVVIKKMQSVYQSGRKGYSWVKIKEPEGTRGKLSDTVDAVVMGYFFAKGQRTSFEIGSVLLGLPDEAQQILTISKVGSGLSEEVAAELVKRTKQLKLKEKPKSYQVSKLLIPDVWLSPQVVIEVAADELTVSSVHTAGLALRFPRFVRFRDDKGVQQSTTVQELQKIVVQ